MKKTLLFICLFFVFCLSGMGMYHVFKPLPPGLGFATPFRPASAIRFFADETFVKNGQRRMEQQLFDQVLEMIHGAREFILVDMFLYNDMMGHASGDFRSLAAELTIALIEQKKQFPDMEIVVISDPINTVYGGRVSPSFEQLTKAGIPVTLTRLERLRDSNPAWSAPYRLLLKPLSALFPFQVQNPFGEGRIPLASFFNLLNFKANHRKVLISDQDGQLVGLVSSANPHDASSAHDNTGVFFNGEAVLDLLDSEKAVLAFSGGPEIEKQFVVPPGEAGGQVSVVTEQRIKEAVLNALDQAKKGDRIDLLMFYLADLDVIKALVGAQQRGAGLRILLDPSKDAFGLEKGGIPNRPAASILHRHDITVRWADTRGEQCHSKMLVARYGDGQATLITGSCNYTRRNFLYNLESNVVVQAPVAGEVITSACDLFERAWSNSNGGQHSLPYTSYEDDSLWSMLKYRWMEFSGMSTF